MTTPNSDQLFTEIIERLKNENLNDVFSAATRLAVLAGQSLGMTGHEIAGYVGETYATYPLADWVDSASGENFGLAGAAEGAKSDAAM